MQYANDLCLISASCAITQATCVSYQAQRCNAYAATATAGGVRVFTPGNVNNCLNKVKSAYGNGTTVVSPTQMTDIDRACNYVWQGKIAQLTPSCTTDYDCAGATDGSIICDADQALCAPKKTVSGTAQCNDVGDVCSQDYYCAHPTAGVSVCTAEAKAGAACTGTPCDHNSRCANGVCAALAQSGEACNSNTDCVSTAPYCNPFGTSVVCSLGLQFASQSPSCLCIGTGMNCPTGWTGMGAPSGALSTSLGSGGVTGGGAGGHAGGAGAGGAAGGHGGGGGGTAGAAGSGAAGAAGSGAAGSGAAGSGAAGAGGGAAGAGGQGGS
jgi:hypothetical protein